MANRENWGSRVGLVLAMAGNAVGLGDLLCVIWNRWAMCPEKP